ncbi:MAG: ester cyclase [Pseudomonadota bacterium]
MHDHLKAKCRSLMADLARGAPVGEAFHPDAVIETSWPWGALSGAALTDFWAGFRTAFPDAQRRDQIAVAGDNLPDPRFRGPRAPHLVASLGTYQATFTAPFLDLPPTGQVIALRFADAYWVEGDKIRWGHMILDLVDVMDQIGAMPLPRPLGAAGRWPGPATGDGMAPLPHDGRAPLETVFGMHDALGQFDGKTLESMPHAPFWTPDFMYYAAGGIGMMRGLSGFQAHHQIPFLRAFPDRSSRGHFIRIAEGAYAVTGGTVTGTHTGPWLGMTPTGRTAELPVFDFYRVEGDTIAENWLPADIAGCAAGLGNDLLARARHYAGAPQTEL